jgi:acyl dehydratase
MPLDPEVVGRTYPPADPYEVGREKIREFADAIGDDNPVYRDPEAAKALGHPDVIAPPTFPVVVTLRASQRVVADPGIGIDYSRVVHGEQRFVAARPVRAGDRLSVTTVIDAVRSVAGNDLLTVRSEVDTTDGEHVCTGYSTLVARGTSGEG